MEEWRPVKGYEGLYEVSDLGNIRSLPKYHYKTSKLLKPTYNKHRGYLSVMLCLNSEVHKRIFVHRIVAEAFVPNLDPEKNKEINHKDENPLNNRADNLEWCDRWYNTHYNNLVERISRPKRKAIIGISPDGEKVSFASISDTKKNGFCSRVISNIINGHRQCGNFYKGYFWEVANVN